MLSISQLILTAAALEWAVWFLLHRYMRDVPACPHCHQTIGVPSWRKSFLRIAYLALLFGSLYAFFEAHPPDDPVDLTLGYVGALLVALGQSGLRAGLFGENWNRAAPVHSLRTEFP